MKLFKITFYFLLFTSFSAIAQMGNIGGNRNINNGIPDSSEQPPSAADIEKERSKRLEKYIALMETELSLDALQVIAIKNEIAASTKSIDIIVKSSYSEESKQKEINAIQVKAEKTINSYLNVSQKEKYIAFKEEKKPKKKEKKQKKQKEKKTE